MPRKAVAVFFLLAFVGAALFVYVTFPRTRDQIPTSNNQRPFPSAPSPAPEPAPPVSPKGPNNPNGVPVPESVPHPNTPKVPPGPTLHVMMWATPAEARRLSAETDAFVAGTGRQVALTIVGNAADYRRDLPQALASKTPPDVILVSSRDFAGLDPAQDLADARPAGETPGRAIAALSVGGQLKAVPDEFLVDVLLYNPALFDRAGIAYPDRHWNWDILEADARALASLKMKDKEKRPIYPLEIAPDFDLWNVLCTEAGHPALDLDTWHLADHDTKGSQMRGLEVIHDLCQELAVTAPAGKPTDPPGRLFAQQRVALLIGTSDLAAAFPGVHLGMTFVPRDLTPGTVARVNGWAVTAKSADPEAALLLSQYLSARPVHMGWTGMTPPADAGSPAAVCHEALAQALVPRITNTKSARMAAFLDAQINQLAHNPQQTPELLFARIQTQFRGPAALAAPQGDFPAPSGPVPLPKADASSSQLRGL